MTAQFSTTNFIHQKASKCFHEEASTLGLIATPDAIHLISKKTGHAAVFMLARIDRNRDDEVTSWMYHPTAHTLKANPDLKGYNLVIAND